MLRNSRGDWTSEKKGSDGPNVVTGVYFLRVSSESSSNMPDRTHPQSAPARQVAQVALRLPNCGDRGGCAGIRRRDRTAWCMSIGYILGQTVQLQRFERAAHHLPSGVLSLRRWFN
jgi:hypothetical protein